MASHSTTTPAFTITRVYEHHALEIKDGLIDQANDAAAELYGFACAADLVGRFISDLQLPISRLAGQLRWVARQEGHRMAQEYITLVHRPDGEVVGHWGKLISVMEGIHGQSYLTQLEGVCQLDEPPVPDLDALGITPEQAVIHTGRYTVAEVRARLADGLPLPGGEKLSTIVAEGERVSIESFGWAPGRGLDFILRGDLCTVCYSEKAHIKTVVSPRFHHPECGWAWDAHVGPDGQPPARRMCPACRIHLDRTPRHPPG